MRSVRLSNAHHGRDNKWDDEGSNVRRAEVDVNACYRWGAPNVCERPDVKSSRVGASARGGHLCVH